MVVELEEDTMHVVRSGKETGALRDKWQQRR